MSSEAPTPSSKPALFHLDLLGPLAQPFTTLVEKIADAVAGVYRPYQIRWVAEAETEAEITRELGKHRIADVQRRAAIRCLAEEAMKQEHIEAIIRKAKDHLQADAKPKDMEKDWITNFFDKCRLTSDDEMQNLWARILAGEANSPGKYSKRTVNFVASLDKQDASMFTTLCRFGWKIGDEYKPLIFDYRNPIYTGNGLTFDCFRHLDSVGLITFGTPFSQYASQINAKSLTVYYFDTPICLDFQKDDDNDMSMGYTLLTKLGQELAPIAGPTPVDGFLDYILALWAQSITLSSPCPTRT